MSTKTSIKRIALVAVSALGFGLLSVVPAKANTAAADEFSAVAIAATSTGRVGNAFTSNVTAALTATVEANEVFVVRGRLNSKPAGSNAAIAFNGTNIDAGATYVYTAQGGAGNELLPAKSVVTADNAATTVVAAYGVGQVGFIPDVLGTYEVEVWVDVDNDGLIDANEFSDTESFVVANAPSSVKVTALSGTGVVSLDALVKLELLDASGSAAGLAANESITLTSSSTDTDFTFINGAAAGGLSTQTLTASSFVKGTSFIGFNDDTAAGATPTITIAGVGGAITSLSATFTQKFVAQIAAPTSGSTVMTTGATTAATYGVASNNGVAGTIAATEIPIGAKTLTYLTTVSSTAEIAAPYVAATITDESGFVTGAGLLGITTDIVFAKAVALTESATTAGSYSGLWTVSTSAPAAVANEFTASVNDDDGAATAGDALDTDTAIDVATVVNALAAGSVTVSPSAALSLKTGTAATYTVTVKDKFGRLFPNAFVSMSISGRNQNQTVVAPTSYSNSVGQATFTYTDAPLAGTTSLTDTITFSASAFGAAAVNATNVVINWSATGPVVGTVTVTTGTEDDTASSITYRDIAAGATGAQAGAATVTVTVKDASGNLLAGVPVTVTTASAGAAVLSTSATVYTGAAGTATASVYGWTAGTKTFTATAGGVSGSGTVNYKQQTATEVRSIEAAISGQIVTVTAKDRFGNTVEGVTIYGTRTGTGFFGNGASSSSAATDKNGVAEFVVNGTGTFKFAAGSATAADVEYGQTASTAGKVGTTAVTAYVAGTSSVAEKGVGDTFAAAGVNSASLAVAVEDSAAAAADAAAEAIDAANAATDAANLAAEAADAATVAAEEARDAADAATAAVEELATQVATLMAALKAQITTLANTVAKIAKKVKA